MEKDKLVSIVIPTYNRENTIVECVNSVLEQTYKAIEVIIVDDCSNDNTEGVIKGLNDDRVFYYRLDKNRRACYARNYGAEKSRGYYVAFQDSDDIWHKDKLEKQLRCLNENDADFIFCGMNRVAGESTFYYPTQRIDTENGFYEQELKLNAISTQTMLMKREVFDSIRFDINLKRFQDWDFAIRVAQSYKVVYLPEALVDSVIQEDSITAVENEYEALVTLYKKYELEIRKYPHIDSSYKEMMGDCFRRKDFRKAKEYFKESLKRKFRTKVLVKYLLSLFGIKY